MGALILPTGLLASGRVLADPGLFRDLFQQDGGFPIHESPPPTQQKIKENNPRNRYVPFDVVH